MIFQFALRPSRIACLAFAMFAACATSPAFTQATPTEMRVIPLSFGIHVIQAEVAQTGRERSVGLMFRQRLGDNQGMVFLFEEDAVQCMWMKNTLIGLSVAFIGPDQRVINVEDMSPQTEDNHCAKGPARYALEMNRGWFARHGVKPGALVSGLPKPSQ